MYTSQQIHLCYQLLISAEDFKYNFVLFSDCVCVSIFTKKSINLFEYSYFSVPFIHLPLVNVCPAFPLRPAPRLPVRKWPCYLNQSAFKSYATGRWGAVSNKCLPSHAGRPLAKCSLLEFTCVKAVYCFAKLKAPKLWRCLAILRFQAPPHAMLYLLNF
jgi:hypothetical protein